MRKVVSVESEKSLAEKARKLIGRKPLRLLAAAVIVAITAAPVVKAESDYDFIATLDEGFTWEFDVPEEEYYDDVQSYVADSYAMDEQVVGGLFPEIKVGKDDITYFETVDGGSFVPATEEEIALDSEMQTSIDSIAPVVEEPVVEEETTALEEPVQEELVVEDTAVREDDFDFSTDIFDCFDVENETDEYVPAVEEEVVTQSNDRATGVLVEGIPEELRDDFSEPGTYSYIDNGADGELTVFYEPPETPDYVLEQERQLYRLDTLISDNYTGVAPAKFIGSENILRNYGDASNDEEVRERAQIIYDHFHNMNVRYGYLAIFNPYTESEYTIQELMDIIKYINGAYIATDSADAERVNDLWFEFMNSITSDPYLVEHINFVADDADVSGITEEDIEAHENVLENLDLSILVMGDSASQPLDKWFANKINEKYRATSREEALSIDEEIILQICAVSAGQGFAVNKVKYTLEDVDRLPNLSYMTLVLVGTAGSIASCPGYIDVDQYGIEHAIYYETVKASFNPLCSEETVAEFTQGNVDMYADANALIGRKQYGLALQLKAMNEAITNGQVGIENYQNKALTKYDEYLQIKNGTYDGSLEEEPELVYKKNN